ncbi:MAG TPA: pantoate--beta-alanine ligase [bacterium]|nr:pantoate--beta-alanine ligase [bacterium]
MRIFRNPRQLQSHIGKIKRAGKTVAFVPTMGALHEGHAALLRRARRSADILVLSIFVNPLQFGPAEDLDRYPRPFANDIALAKRERVDIVFAPGIADIYHGDRSTHVEESGLSRGLCGAARPGHFRGVTTVVAKLFNIVRPDSAFFGQKDYQQYKVIERMARDLDLPVKVVMVSTVREKDGLALSSRNAYLSAGERATALAISGALSQAVSDIKKGKTCAGVAGAMRERLQAAGIAQIDYAEIVNADTLKVPHKGDRRLVAAIAAWVGKTRLIDNMLITRE